MSTNENSKVPQNETTWVAPKKTLAQRMKPYMGFYLMFLPVFIFVLIVYYWPMLGVRYAFYTYKLRDIHFIGL
jgi:putative aldouronate transport system permease protein